jgi:hypothetical protein
MGKKYLLKDRQKNEGSNSMVLPDAGFFSLGNKIPVFSGLPVHYSVLMLPIPVVAEGKFQTDE